MMNQWLDMATEAAVAVPLIGRGLKPVRQCVLVTSGHHVARKVSPHGILPRAAECGTIITAFIAKHYHLAEA